jgi:hypothetical protein
MKEALIENALHYLGDTTDGINFILSKKKTDKSIALATLIKLVEST